MIIYVRQNVPDLEPTYGHYDLDAVYNDYIKRLSDALEEAYPEAELDLLRTDGQSVYSVCYESHETQRDISDDDVHYITEQVYHQTEWSLFEIEDDE